MNKEDIKHLSHLARIELKDSEVENFSEEISAIISYVSVIQDIVGEGNSGEMTPEVGARFNVFREDVVTNQPDGYKEALLKEMPNTKNGYMVVKKILQTDTE
jgi:aspartyl-tRNA(Asn)/glutamyl-tRNA(Gln) amidotransferase subunit C